MSDKKRMNIKALSELSGFSTCTVSRVISGRAEEFRISKATEEKVLQVVEENGYRPDYLAQSLNLRKTMTLGLIFANKVGPYLGSIMEGVEGHLRGTDYQMTVATCEGSLDVLDAEVRRMHYRQVDGIILFPPAIPVGSGFQLPEPDVSIKQIPMVVVGRSLSSLRGHKMDHVLMEDVQAGEAVALDLLSHGCKSFGFAMSPSDCSSDNGRRQGFEETLLRNGISRERIQIVVEANGPTSESLHRLKEVDGFFGVNTNLLLKYIKGLSGLRNLTEGVQLISVGEIDGRELLSIPVRTLGLPGKELGAEAARLCLWRLEHPKAGVKGVQMPLDLSALD